MNDISNTKRCPFCGHNHRDYQCVDDLIAERNRLWTEVDRLRTALEAEQKKGHDVAMGPQACDIDESPPTECPEPPGTIKCPNCGGKTERAGNRDWWMCHENECLLCGPHNDFDGSKIRRIADIVKRVEAAEKSRDELQGRIECANAEVCCLLAQRIEANKLAARLIAENAQVRAMLDRTQRQTSGPGGAK